eukprot:GFYU01004019.1.p1 GENE.GFYU01004019.1~~GFYU01004019.1.p1  ORF type:complete len:286 (-),score=87.61 GFYU01004019.1:188-1045(-)
MPAKIMVALDGTDSAYWAFRYAVSQINKDEGDSVYLLAIAKSLVPKNLPQPLTWAGSDEILASQQKRINEGTEKMLLTYGKHVMKKTGLTTDRVHLVMLTSNDPKSAICKAVEQKTPDMLVIGQRKLGVLSEMKAKIVSTTSSYVAKHADTTVVVIKEQEVAPSDESAPLAGQQPQSLPGGGLRRMPTKEAMQLTRKESVIIDIASVVKEMQPDEEMRKELDAAAEKAKEIASQDLEGRYAPTDVGSSRNAALGHMQPGVRQAGQHQMHVIEAPPPVPDPSDEVP